MAASRNHAMVIQWTFIEMSIGDETSLTDRSLSNEGPAKAAGHKAEGMMKLNAPTMPVFVVSLILAVLAVLSVFTPIPYVSMYAFWVAIAGYVVLAVGTLMKM